MATKYLLCGGALIQFNDANVSAISSNENGIQSFKVYRNTGNVLLVETFSGGLAFFYVTPSAPVVNGALTMVTVT